METIQQELAELYQRIISKEKIELHLKNLDRLILEKEAEQKTALFIMEQEARDVEKLEARNLYSVFSFILGNKEEELAKERQEYLQAFLQEQSIRNCIKELKREKEVLLRSYSSKYGLETAFDKMVKNKQDKLVAKWPSIGKYLIQYESRIANHRSKIEDLKEAIKEGKKTIRMLQKCLINLEKIEIWGSSRDSKKVKTNRIRARDKVQHSMQLAENYLAKFEKELFDISDHVEFDYSRQVLEIKDFIYQFYDSLISDWIVKNRIDNSSNLIRNFSDKLERIVAMLEQDHLVTRSYIKQEQRDRRALVMKGMKE